MSDARAGVVRGLQGLWRDHLRGLRGHDLALTAGGVTFYAGIALVPTTLVAVRAAAALTSPERVHSLGGLLARILPDALGAPAAAQALVAAGLSMTWLATLIAAVPATFYGEGLRRAFGTLSRTRDSYTGWRGRLHVVPLFGVTPLLLLAMLFVVPTCPGCSAALTSHAAPSRSIWGSSPPGWSYLCHLVTSTAWWDPSRSPGGRWPGALRPPARSSPASCRASCSSCPCPWTWARPSAAWM